MRALALGVILAIPFSFPLAADTREVEKTKAFGHEFVSALYLKGERRRIESLDEYGAQRTVQITNVEQKTTYTVDLAARQYSRNGPWEPDLILSLASLIARPPRPQKPDKTVNVYYEAIDTGERRRLLGRTAKHLIIRERRVAESGACEPSRESNRDGWYVPWEWETLASQDGYHRYAGRLRFGLGGCEETVITHDIPSPPGVLVLKTEGQVTREVVELSNASLDESLFEVPKGFKNVDRPVDPSQRLAVECGMLESAFESWFQ